MVDTHQKYEFKNLEQEQSEFDPFTLERYKQFSNFFLKGTLKILDVGCNTGRGGAYLKEIYPSLELFGLDCVRDRLNALPSCYSHRIYGLSTEIPKEDNYFDAIVAGEFLEHLYPIDVDRTICEFQRVLKIGGRLLLTTPNPNYLKNKISRTSIYGVSHLTQHYPRILRHRLLSHGFSNVRIYGSGKVSRYLGYHFPMKFLYGSYLVLADKF